MFAYYCEVRAYMSFVGGGVHSPIPKEQDCSYFMLYDVIWYENAIHGGHYGTIRHQTDDNLTKYRTLTILMLSSLK